MTHFIFNDTRTGKQLRHRVIKRKRDKQRVICLDTGSLWQVNERLSISDMRKEMPMFFNTAHGNRETFTVYRGQLIVRNTVQFTGCRPQRKTTVYLVVTHEVSRGNWHRTENFETFCMGSDWSGIASAKKAIDRVLDSGYEGNA